MIQNLICPKSSTMTNAFDPYVEHQYFFSIYGHLVQLNENLWHYPFTIIFVGTYGIQGSLLAGRRAW